MRENIMAMKAKMRITEEDREEKINMKTKVEYPRRGRRKWIKKKRQTKNTGKRQEDRSNERKMSITKGRQRGENKI